MVCDLISVRHYDIVQFQNMYRCKIHIAFSSSSTYDNIYIKYIKEKEKQRKIFFLIKLRLIVLNSEEIRIALV